MKTAGIIIVVLAIFIVGGAALLIRSGPRSNPGNSSPAQSSGSTSQSSTSNTTSSTSQSSEPGRITITNNMFTPSQITVPKGGSVVWTNNDDTAHSVIVDQGEGPTSGTINPGSTYTYTFNKSGSFQYHCGIHSSMRGTIVVK